MRQLAGTILVALVLVSDAPAGIYVEAVTPAKVQAGGLIRVRISAGLRLWEKVPLYIVPSARALRPHPCRRDAVCEPKVPGPPTRGAYHRVATVSFRVRLEQVVAVRVPRVPSGRYEIAFYCGPCYKGPGGSLISTPTAAFEVVRP
jgi:hypothetical protein